MPTWERTSRFDRDWAGLTADDQACFRRALDRFVEDLPHGRFRAGLRVKRVQGTDGILEMTRSPDGRATFEFGPAGPAGAHVIWRRIGRHDVLGRP